MTNEDSAPWWTTSTTLADDPPPPASPPEGSVPVHQPRRPRRWLRPVAASVAVLAVALGAGTAGAEIALRLENDSPATVGSAAAVSGGTQPSETLAKVAAAVQPSVVTVAVETGGGSSEGSGVILRSDGMILTNNHVVESAAAGGGITVTFADGKTSDATIVGRDEATDLAVIQASDASGLTPATLGSSETLHVGDTVLAIGSPLGLEGSVSAGIVSALHRPVDIGDGQSSATLGDAIQTDAPINPGNSGGPLVDTKGRVVGINTAIATLSSGVGGQSGSIGVGFAIPVDDARKVADALMDGEQPTHAVLGVQASDVAPAGARIESLTPSGAAAGGGLQVGDVLVSIGDTQVEGASALAAAIRAHQPGDRVRVTYIRDGATRTATVTLGSAT